MRNVLEGSFSVRRSVVGVLSTCLAMAVMAAPAGATIGGPAPAVVTRADVVPAPELSAKSQRWSVYGPDGRLKGTSVWRSTPAGAKCREGYLTAPPGRRAGALRGTVIFFS